MTKIILKLKDKWKTRGKYVKQIKKIFPEYIFNQKDKQQIDTLLWENSQREYESDHNELFLPTGLAKMTKLDYIKYFWGCMQ